MSTLGGFKIKPVQIILTVTIILVIAFGAQSYASTLKQQPKPLIVSTTTSLYETGLLTELKTKYENTNPHLNISYISQGTGVAIETAKRGDADLILVHAPSKEFQFLEDGYGVNRKIIAFNYFIIVGPESDPAGIRGLQPMDALRKISARQDEGVFWVSRGDNSGTHIKEKLLWDTAGIDLEALMASDLYVEAGSGMTATLRLANQRQAYTLTDTATFLKITRGGDINIVRLVDSGKETINVYSAMIVHPENVSDEKFDLSMMFIEFLVSEEAQQIISVFGEEEFGTRLFNAWVPLMESQSDPDVIAWVEEAAFLEGSECPEEYRYDEGDLYR